MSRVANAARMISAAVSDRCWRASCDRKISRALEAITAAPLNELCNVERLTSMISAAGLAYDNRNLYGADAIHMNRARRGLWQIPRQLAECLCHLSQFKINSFAEIGTYTGYTFAIIATYLRRFSDEFRALTIDVKSYHPFKLSNQEGFRVDYLTATSVSLAGQAFDLVLVDGDHSYDAVVNDYMNVGRAGAFCAFHDINDEMVAMHPANDGGVPRFWEEVRGRFQCVEFLYHSEGKKVMGIGVLHQRNVEGDVA